MRNRIKKFENLIPSGNYNSNDKNISDIVLRYWAFDWDDNILDMPTKILMDQKIGEKWLPIQVSTADFARIRTDVENYRIRNNNPVEAFSEFRDTGLRGNEAFIEDVEECIADGHFGPAFDKFLLCLSEGSIFSIITARGHEPESIKKGVEYIIDNILAQKSGSISGMSMADEMYQNIRKFKFWFESDNNSSLKFSGKASEDPLVQEYLSHCDYFGVSSNSFANKFSGGSVQAPEESKNTALKYSIKKCLSYAKRLEESMGRSVKVTYGMSDDDPKTSIAIKELFDKIINSNDIFHEDKAISKYLKLYYFQTTGGEVDKTVYETKPDNLMNADELKESSHQAPGLESSVMPFNKWNNMTQRLYPNSKDAPTDDYHNQFKNFTGLAKDLYTKFGQKVSDVKFSKKIKKKKKKPLTPKSFESFNNENKSREEMIIQLCNSGWERWELDEYEDVELAKLCREVPEESVSEKWKGDVEVQHTGEHADKTIAEINNEIKKLKKRTEKIKEEGKKVPKTLRSKMSQLYFAKRAKQGWKKGRGSSKV